MQPTGIPNQGIAFQMFIPDDDFTGHIFILKKIYLPDALFRLKSLNILSVKNAD